MKSDNGHRKNLLPYSKSLFACIKSDNGCTKSHFDIVFTIDINNTIVMYAYIFAKAKGM